MKKSVLVIIFTLGVLFSTTKLPQLQSVYAQEINLNIGETAQEQGIVGTTNLDSEDAGFSLLIERILTIVMTVGALLLLFYLIWGGVEWITSGGDKGKTESARNKITQAVIGLIVLAASIAIFNLVQSFLGIKVLQFENNSSQQEKRPTDPAPTNPKTTDDTEPTLRGRAK